MKITVNTDNEYNHLIERFVKFCCKELCVLPMKIHVESVDMIGNTGMCIDEDPGIYTILIKSENRNLANVFTTLAHEMVHVKQYMTQDLGRILDEEKDTPYDQRWWEMEAAEQAVPLVEKFAKTL